MHDDFLPPKLAFPCPKRWQDLQTGEGQRRFCDQCQLHVHDLSAMTRREGRALLERTGGQVCVSFATSPDGSMVTRRRWGGLAQGWGGLRRGALALLALVTPFSLAACRSPAVDRTGGKVCVDTVGGDGKLPHGVTTVADTERTLGTPLPPGR